MSDPKAEEYGRLNQGPFEDPDKFLAAFHQCAQGDQPKVEKKLAAQIWACAADYIDTRQPLKYRLSLLDSFLEGQGEGSVSQFCIMGMPQAARAMREQIANLRALVAETIKALPE